MQNLTSKTVKLKPKTLVATISAANKAPPLLAHLINKSSTTGTTVVLGGEYEGRDHTVNLGISQSCISQSQYLNPRVMHLSPTLGTKFVSCAGQVKK